MYDGKPILKKFYDGLSEGKFYATKCPKCGDVEFPPLPTCNTCGCLDMEWIELTGEGTVTDLGLTGDRFRNYQGAFPEFGFGYVTMDGGSQTRSFPGAILGVTNENYEEMRTKLPLRVKAEVHTVTEVPRIFFSIVE